MGMTLTSDVPLITFTTDRSFDPIEHDFVFTSIDEVGTPSALNQFVLNALKMNPRELPGAHDLAKGFSIEETGYSTRLVYVVTVSKDQETEDALATNFENALRQIGLNQKILGPIWIPLMGTGSGGLDVSHSFEIISNVISQFLSEDITTISKVVISSGTDASARDLKRISSIANRVFERNDVEVSFEKSEKRSNRVRQKESQNYSVNPQSDVPARSLGEDAFGRAQVAANLAARLTRMRSGLHGATVRAAWMVHLYAPWGGGKTSFLNFLRTGLIAQTPSWTVVEFNAWQHQRVSPPWWFLLKAIERAILGELDWCQHIEFRAKFLWSQISQVGPWNLLSRVVFLSFLGSLIFFVSFKFQHNAATPELADKLLSFMISLVGVVSTLALWAKNTAFELRYGSPESAQRLAKWKNDPMKELESYFRSLLDAFGDRPIAVFVDDLDRCDARYAVNLLEGIQTIFDDPRILYVIAADKRWLEGCYTEEYKSFSNHITRPGRAIGSLFLEKAFEMSFSLPTPREEAADDFWSNLITEPKPTNVTDDTDERKRLSSELGVGGITINDIDSYADRRVAELKDGPHGAAGMSKLRDVILEKISEETYDNEVEHFLSAYPQFVNPNPRGMKRLLNAYLMFRDLAIADGNIGSAPVNVLSPLGANDLVKWLILYTDAPLLLDALERLLANESELDGKALLKSVREAAPQSDLFELANSSRIASLFEKTSDGPAGQPLRSSAIRAFSGLKGSDGWLQTANSNDKRLI